jgi:hypothetical protein
MKLKHGLLLVVLVLFTIGPILGKDTLWATTRTKMLTAKGYAVNYSYEGPEGKFLFHYIVQGEGQKILTEVLEGSTRGAGTRIYYEPAKDEENVFMETRFITLRRSLEAGDIKDSSLYQPLFAQILSELPTNVPAEILPFGDGQIFVFGEKAKVQARVTVDGKGNPISYRRLEKGKEVKKFIFNDLDWGSHAIVWED